MTHIIDEIAYSNAIKRNIIRNAQKTFLKSEDNKKALDHLLTMEETGKTNDFSRSLLDSYYTYGKLSEKQVNAVLKGIEALETKKAEWKKQNQEKNALSNFVGKEKDKIEVKLTCTNILELQGQSFHYYDDGLSFLSIFSDETGNIYTYTGKKIILDKNETATIKATIKGHKEFNGIKQTQIIRLKAI